MSSKTALMIIDVQEGFFTNFDLYQPTQLLERLKSLIAKARAANVPIIFVRHESDLENDGDIHPDIYPQDGDIVVSKLESDSFFNTTLQDELSKLDIKKLVIGGLQSEFCVDTTTRRAFSMGYEAILVKDAHSTIDFDDAPLTAAQMIAHHTLVLGSFATVLAADEVVFE